MINLQNKRWHGATFLGILTLVAAIFLPIINIKKNRIDLGSIFKLSDFSPFIIVIYFTFLLGLIFSYLFLDRFKFALYIRQILGLLIVVFLGLIILEANKILLASGELKSIISFESGFYTLLLGAYFMIFGSVQMLKNSKSYKNYIAYIILALIVSLFLYINGEYLGIVKEFIKERSRLKKEVIIHISIALRSVLYASIIGIPLGLLTLRSEKLKTGIFGLINSVQTIPSLALFGLLIAPLSILSNSVPFFKAIGVKGIGETPALIALTLYALLPIVRNTYTGLDSINPAVIESGRGMGMSVKQTFFKIKLPLSLPILLTGVKIAAIQSIGNTTVAALIGAGGLGYFVFRGLEQIAPDLILVGVIPIILLVLVSDKLLSLFIKLLTPAPLRKIND